HGGLGPEPPIMYLPKKNGRGYRALEHPEVPHGGLIELLHQTLEFINELHEMKHEGHQMSHARHIRELHEKLGKVENARDKVENLRHGHDIHTPVLKAR